MAAEGETLGSAKVDLTVDTSQFDAAIKLAQTRTSQMSAQAQADYQKLSAVEKRRVDNLIDQANKISLTKDQQLAYNAALKTNGSILDEITRKLAAAQSATKGMSEGQLAFAQRMLPAQMTDIITGLSTGQSPFTVLMQQGGQLKDMFGGIVPAAKAVGGAVLGLISPLTITAAAVGVLALAYEKGISQTQAFNQANALTGNISGMTAQDLGDMATNMSKVVGSTNQNVDALTRIVSTGKITADQFKDIGAAAIAFGRATGESLDDVIEEFVALGDKPAEAIAKLNESQHFLTSSIYDQIKALEDQGKTAEATALAQETYAANLKTQAAQIDGNLGTLQRAWRSLGEMATSAWDAMLNIGRPAATATLQSQLDAVNKQIADMGEFASSAGGAAFGNPNISKQNRERLLKMRDDLQAELQKRSDGSAAAAKKASEQRLQDQKIAAKQWLDTEDKSLRDNKAKRDEEIADYKKYGALYGLTAEQIQAGIAKIEAKYADKKGSGVKSDAGQSVLEQRRQEQASLQAQLDSSEKLTSAQQQLAKDQQLFNDLAASKEPLTVSQQQLLAKKDQILAQDEINARLADEINKRKDALAIANLQQQTQDLLAKQQAQYAEELAGYSLGPQAQQQLREQQKFLDQYSDMVMRANRDHNKENGTSDSTYQAQLANAQTLLDGQLSLLSKHYDDLKAIRGDWEQGALGGLNDYLEKTQNVAASMRDVFSDGFKGMEDALATFVTSGKLNFTSFANSIISDLARIAVRQAITGPLVSALGSLFGGVAGGSGASLTGGVTTGAVDLSSSITMTPLANAKGGVYNSPSLSSYRNGIYDKPQLFAFAKGAGVFGEAGPEAIMPLKRMADGSLGVRTAGGSAGGMGDVNIYINGDGSSEAQTSPDLKSFGNDVKNYVDARFKQLMAGSFLQGGMNWKASNGMAGA